MKRLYRLLLAWLLMLALPLQGYAGTHMLMCSADAGAPARHAAARAAQDVPPCHAHMAQTAASDQPHAQVHDQPGTDNHQTSHDSGKPGSCAACSLLTPVAPGVASPPGLDGPVSAAIPFDARRLASIDPTLPDRPPRLAAA